MPAISHDGIEIYYELHGSGPPLLLIAGLASDSQSWLPALPGLAERYQVIVLDNRCVGRSTQECETSIELMAEDCRLLLDHLGLEGVPVAGHSMGGMVALELALRYPRLVGKLALIATTACNPVRNNLMFGDWADWYEDSDKRPAWLRMVLAWVLTPEFFDNLRMLEYAINYQLDYPWPQSAAALRRQVHAIAAYDVTDRLPLISMPTFVMAAGRDILLPLPCSQQLASRIPGAQLMVLEDAAHSIHSEYAEEFVRLLSSVM